MPQPCKFVNAPGGCRRPYCPFDHDQSMSGSSSSSQICKFYQQGNCRAGSSCRFQHDSGQNNQPMNGLAQQGAFPFAGSSAGTGFGQTQPNNPFQSQSQASSSVFGRPTTTASNPFAAGFGLSSSMGGPSTGFSSGSTMSQFTSSVFGQKPSSEPTSSNPFSTLQTSSSNPFQQQSATSNPFQSSSATSNPFQSSTSSLSSFSTPSSNPFASQTAPPSGFSNALTSSSNNPFASSTFTTGPMSGPVSNPFASSGITSFSTASLPPMPASSSTSSFPPSQSAFTSNSFPAANPTTAPHTNSFAALTATSAPMTSQPSGDPLGSSQRISADSQPLTSAFPTALTSIPSNENRAGQDRSGMGIFSDEADLSQSDRYEYSADKFSRIPFLPPARSMV